MSGPVYPYTGLNFDQVIRQCFDEVNDRLRVDAQVTATIGEVEVTIDHINDSIRIGDGVNLVTTSTVGSKVGLDVNIISGSITGYFSPTGLVNGLKVTRIIVNDTPTKIPSTALSNRNGISIRVWGSNVVFFGDSSVTTVSGYPKFQYEEFQADIRDTSAVDVYGICSTGLSSEVRVMEVS